MLEPCFNQAAGLQALGLPHTLRLAALASHGRQQGELPLLWGLCARWVDMGLSVVVLDGHARESDANAGLQQLLENPLRRTEETAETTPWLVLPAAAGLQQLCATDLLCGNLAEVFKGYDIALVYANADDLARLLRGRALAPLLVMPPAPDAALSGYAALKTLLLSGQLHPTVANILPETPDKPTRMENANALKLQQCAASFLSYRLPVQTVLASASVAYPHDDLQHLALQLFENALALQPSSLESLH